ncbi:trigger factor [Selenomonas sputigena]|uniref:Trigger factor n=1 Tax=Selenomonas sputigena TaxID=69823 RepID=A0ABV3X2C4_9FIRM
MKVTAEKMDNHEVVLTIEVEADALKKAETKACKDLASRVSIPGFRKGKAPRHIIEQRVGKKAILDAAFDLVADKAFLDAIKEQDVVPVSRPDIETLTLEEGQDVVFKARFTAKPEVKLGEYKGLKIEKKVDAVTDTDVDNELENMRRRRSQMVDAPEGASVKTGDLVTLDFKGFVNNEPFEGGEGKDYPLEIGSNRFIPGFEEQLIGIKIGEQRDVNVTFPEEYHSQELAGKAAKFECVIHSIKERQLPELNDEFARKVSKFQTLAELKVDIRKNLEQNAEKKAENDQHAAAIEQATENIIVDIPTIMVDNRVTLMIQEMAMRLEQQGMKLEQYLQYAGTDLAQIREKYRKTAEENVKTDLMLEAVAKAENIEVNDKDLEAEISAMAMAYGATPAQVRKIVKEQGRIADLVTTVLRKKTTQFILDNIVE